MPNSRIGSDLAARARGIQLGDMPERRPPQMTPGSQEASETESPPHTRLHRLLDHLHSCLLGSLRFAGKEPYQLPH